MKVFAILLLAILWSQVILVPSSEDQSSTSGEEDNKILPSKKLPSMRLWYALCCGYMTESLEVEKEELDRANGLIKIQKNVIAEELRSDDGEIPEAEKEDESTTSAPTIKTTTSSPTTKITTSTPITIMTTTPAITTTASPTISGSNLAAKCESCKIAATLYDKINNIVEVDGKRLFQSMCDHDQATKADCKKMSDKLFAVALAPVKIIFHQTFLCETLFPVCKTIPGSCMQCESVISFTDNLLSAVQKPIETVMPDLFKEPMQSKAIAFMNSLFVEIRTYTKDDEKSSTCTKFLNCQN